MPKILHCYPIEIGENDSADDSRRNETTVVLIILNPIENLVASIGHEEL